ncbi:MFS transporter [Methylobacterium durans]|uniref:Cyanate transporter n=1 Tax=Methylobacterium durans TaxID=2202825 RepID=A0A2U8WGI8_9HYPH|nr:MFS transporter [Methylobacterium durans]AWN44648.1 cyanate transporter [Methylobacterium durans]
MSAGESRPPILLLGAGLLLVAFNLRPALTTVGPLLSGIRAETGLGAAGAAFLTTLPVLFLGIASALGPTISRRLGPDRGVLLAILVVAAGLSLRALGGLVPLFLGACVSAAGIGLAGGLLPGLVKRDFPGHVGLVTGLYTMTLCLGAAAGSGLTVPLLDILPGGWAAALAAWAVPALIASLAWAPLALARPHRAAAGAAGSMIAGIARHRLAWQVTGFMGLQSSLAYIAFAWLPSVLQDRGLSPVDAGFVASLMSLGQAPSALLVPTLAARAREQRAYVVALVSLTVCAFLGLLIAPTGLVAPLAVGLGFGLGGTFGLGLTIIVLRARDPASAAALSALAQGVGYAIAALGPFGFGLAHETDGWNLSAALFCAFALGALLFGLHAGRARTISAESEPVAR